MRTDEEAHAQMPDVFDVTAALERIEFDRELLTELAGTFFDECPRLVADARDAVSRRDARALERAAHTLKGSVSNFCAKASFDAASALEAMGRENDLAHADDACVTLERELSRFHRAWDVVGREVLA